MCPIPAGNSVMFARRAHAAQTVSCRGGCHARRTSVSASPGGRIRAGPVLAPAGPQTAPSTAGGVVYRHIFQFEPACAVCTTPRPDRYARVPRISFPFAGFGPGTGFNGNCRWGKTRGTARVRATSRGSDRRESHGRVRRHTAGPAEGSARRAPAARAAGDADLTDTQLDEIEHLNQIAAAHGISEPARA